MGLNCVALLTCNFFSVNTGKIFGDMQQFGKKLTDEWCGLEIPEKIKKKLDMS